MNYYQHHIGDYRGGTTHLSWLEHYVYRTLLDLYYDKEGPIPSETDWVMRRLRAETEEQKKAVLSVLNDFFEATPQGFRHAVCEENITSYRAKADVARINGHLGGRPRKERVPTDLKPTRNPGGSDGKPDRKLTKNHKPLTNESPLPPKGAVSGFDEFWEQHPRKVGKPVALKSYLKALTRSTESEIMAGLKRHLPVWKAKAEGGDLDKVPHPSTWLNRDGWNDQVAPVAGEAMAKPWHETLSGCREKAVELGVEDQRADEQALRFMARVRSAAGIRGDANGMP